jgi:CDP-diacylglycerol--glycerol-3-phosphate 3-phosphatidyltransferase
MNKNKFEKIKDVVSDKIEKKVLFLKVLDEPRPDYVSKITIIDKILDKTILWIFPKFVRPNFLTVFRFISVPFVILLLLNESYVISFWFFTISAITDALDGAIARTRHQITDWGIVFDPLADKLLIGSTAIIVISKFINPILAWTIVILEAFLILFSYLRFKGEIVPAKIVGKIKMILQSIGISLLLLAVAFNFPILIIVATYTLYTAIFFSLLSLFVYRSI